MKTILITLAALGISTSVAFSQMSHDKDHSNMPMAEQHMEGAVHAKAVVNSIGKDMANVSHGPIPEIGWPAMTMDLPFLENAQMMGEIAAGDEVTLMLVKGDDGMYAIGAMMPN